MFNPESENWKPEHKPCDCLTCKYSRKELTKEQYIFGMKNRLEVWQIVNSYFKGMCDITEENLHYLGQNICVAIDEINMFLEEATKEETDVKQ